MLFLLPFKQLVLIRFIALLTIILYFLSEYLFKKSTLAILTGFYSRIVLSFILMYAALPSIYTYDENTYNSISEALLFEKTLFQDATIPLFPKITGAIYSFLGYHLVISKLWTSFTMMLAIIIFWQIALKLNSQLPKWGIWVMVFNPSLLFWSAIHLKDSLMALLMGFALISVLAIEKKHVNLSPIKSLAIKAVGLFSGCLASVLLYNMRNYWALISIVIITSGIFIIIISKFKFKKNILLFLLLVIGVFAALFLMKSVPLAYLEKVHNEMCRFSRTPINPNLEFNSWSDFYLYLPKGIYAFLFSPFPWNFQISIFHILSALESTFYFILFPLGILSVLKQISKFDENTFPGTLISLSAAIFLIFLMHGFMEGNVGTSIRHRTIFILFIMPHSLSIISEYFKTLKVVNSGKSTTQKKLKIEVCQK